MLHLLLNLARIVMSCFGIAYWQRAYADSTEKEDLFDQKVIELTQDAQKVGAYILIIAGFILDLVSCYRARIKRFIFHFELVLLLVQGLIPYEYGGFTVEIISVYTVLIFAVFGNEQADRITSNIILTMICLTIVFHLEIPVLSKEKWKT